MVFSMEHAMGAPVPQIANPIKFSRSAIKYLRPPPMLGEHTTEVLASIGLTDSNLEELQAAGLIHGPGQHLVDAN
jgi:formyl-CoA transferase